MENIGKVWFKEKGGERGGEEDYFSRCEDGNVQTLAEKNESDELGQERRNKD